jgi:hypothetical protein
MITAAIGSAGTIPDTFGQTQNSSALGGCNPNATYTASTACDVFGDEMKFDIQSATVTVAGGVGTVTLYSNLGGVTSPLANFTVGNTTLKPGDLFLYDPSDNGTISNFVNNKSTGTGMDFASGSIGTIESDLTYAIPLVSHNSLTAGDLYAVNPGNIDTAQQYLAPQNPNGSYRNNLPTMIDGGTQLPATTGINGVTVTSTGDNGTNTGTNPGALYAITVKFAIPSGSPAWLSSSNIGILWSSADCGNDFIQGAVPEPSSFALLLGGAMLIAGSVFARRSAARSRS